MIRLSCPMCGKKLAVDDARAGALGTCPGCRHKIRIPGEPATRAKAPASAGQSSPLKQASPKEQQPPATPAPAQVKSPEESWRKTDHTPYAFKEEGAKPPPPPELRSRRGGKGGGIDFEMEFARRPRITEKKSDDPELLPGFSYFKALFILSLIGLVGGNLYTYQWPGFYLVLSSLLLGLAICVGGFTWCLFLVMKRNGLGSGKPLLIGILGIAILASVFATALAMRPWPG